ncbi:hypothetical protein CARUB_v10006165mg [Capsella rubella]|uniref:Uncharacterized protein n=1 Tax=Capsella rubella TaxID=81985 RepID=R0GZM5_9BRAS|nr:hypothetical protein CARUB_v10006165mg [Capsella rubella]EOA17776.1 hypothetical protein CARUB_v10006165mg [Capsella rubella]
MLGQVSFLQKKKVMTKPKNDISNTVYVCLCLHMKLSILQFSINTRGVEEPKKLYNINMKNCSYCKNTDMALHYGDT